MSKHFLRQIARLKQMVAQLAREVDAQVEAAIHAVADRDVDLARRVIEGDERIDTLEVDIEEECLHTLALHQPVAFDLRFVISVVKINHELERIGDLAVKIAERAITLSKEAPLHDQLFDLEGESSRVRSMCRRAIESLIAVDADLAARVRADDDAVDAIYDEACHKIEAAIRRDPEDLTRLLTLLHVSRHLERLADHAVNIADDVVYMARGEVTRHDHVVPGETFPARQFSTPPWTSDEPHP